ncbi:hypothetical protein [Prescottella subtropica]|uniref:hypothetical protein n=1 Tax=Prescottella subtropica TaxID=2545757 RepID=UPI0010F5405A|nr:hypothetical protein [Prescottella subtropica]
MSRPFDAPCRTRCLAAALAVVAAAALGGCRTVADPPPDIDPSTTPTETIDPGNPQPSTPTTSRWGPFDEGQIHGPVPPTAVPPAP